MPATVNLPHSRLRRLLPGIASLLTATATFFLLCLSSGVDAAARLEPITLQLKWQHQFQFAGYYAAQAQGYYRDAGLDVTILEAEPGKDPVAAVISGHAQYGVGSSALLLKRQQGKPVVVLAAIYQHSPLVLLARSSSGIDSIHDLRGKRLMLEHQSDELLAYLQQEGVPRTSLQFQQHNFDPGALLRGETDVVSAYSTDEPWFLEQAKFKFLSFSPRAAGIDFYGDNLFTTEAELRSHPARVRAFREASLRGWRYAMQYPEEIADLILARYGERHGREYLLYEARHMRSLIQPDLVEMGYMYPGRWRHIADTYAELGLLPKDFPLEGFLYDPSAGQRRVQQQMALILAVALAIGGVCGGLALVFLRMNRRLKSQLREIQALQASVREQAVRDPLTELYNRRYLDENFDRELARARREGQALSLAAIDIDHFKQINDNYGHPAGDQVLRALAALLLTHTRSSDIVCRHGGEEFMLLMPDMSAEDARLRAEAWREDFAALVVTYGESRINTTFSVGIATFPEHGQDMTPLDLTAKADRALYAAKRQGRNRVELYREQGELAE